MRAAFGDALICDFAQFYHVYDIDALDVRTASVLASGLPKESRVIRELTGNKPDQEIILLAYILDTVRSVEYAVYQAHSKKRLKKPKPVAKKILGLEDRKQGQDIKGFRTSDDFEAARNRLLQET